MAKPNLTAEQLWRESEAEFKIWNKTLTDLSRAPSMTGWRVFIEKKMKISIFTMKRMIEMNKSRNYNFKTECMS